MADPTSKTVTLVTLLAGTSVGVAAEFLVQWAGIILGAGVGGLIACSLAADLKDKGFLARLSHWWIALLFGVIAAPVGMLVLTKIAGPIEAGSGLGLLPFVSMIVSAFWRRIVSDIPSMWDKWRDKP
jgi:hypothetical protein